MNPALKTILRTPAMWVAFAVTVVTLSAAFVIMRQHSRITKLETDIALEQDQQWKARIDSTRVVAETIAVHMERAAKVVTRDVEHVRVDTFVVAPKSAADTAHAVAQLPTLVIAHDQLQRDCTDLKNSCLAYRDTVAKERREIDLRIAGLVQAAQRTPGRRWVGVPDLVAGGGECATSDGLRPCLFVGVAARLGW